MREGQLGLQRPAAAAAVSSNRHAGDVRARPRGQRQVHRRGAAVGGRRRAAGRGGGGAERVGVREQGRGVGRVYGT